MVISFPDVVRGFERSYSRLADQAADYLFSFAVWFARGSWFDIGLKAGVLVLILAGIHYALGGATAMGDKKPVGPTIMWASVALAAVVVVAVVLVKS